MGKRSCIYALTLLCLSVPMQVNAQTTTDLYSKFSVPSLTQYQTTAEQIEDAELDYSTKDSEYTYIINYNEVIDSLDTEALKQSIDEMSTQRDAIANELNVNGYNLTITEIKNLYSQYKSLCSSIEESQKRYSNYSNRSKLTVPNYDFDAMNQNIENLKALEQQQLDASEIGEIDNIVNFVQTPYCVKVAFDNVGTTIKTKEDTGVLSLFSGTVTYADKDENGVEMVTINSGDNISITYRNLKARYVQTGDNIEQYQKIATTKEDLYVIIQIGDSYYDVNKLYGGK